MKKEKKQQEYVVINFDDCNYYFVNADSHEGALREALQEFYVDNNSEITNHNFMVMPVVNAKNFENVSLTKKTSYKVIIHKPTKS